MDYDQNYENIAQARAGAMRAQQQMAEQLGLRPAGDCPPENLTSMLDNLTNQVQRAQAVARRIDGLCDQVHGARPTAGNEACRAPSSSLDSLISELAMALTDAETHLSRL